MKELKNISAYRIILFLLISVYFNNYFLIFLITIYYLFNKRFFELFIYITCYILIIICNYKVDFIKYGVISEVKDSYYVLDNFIYKTKVYTNNSLKIGDIIKCFSTYKVSDINDLKNNYLFICNGNYEYISFFKLQYKIYDIVNSFDGITNIYLKKYLYNVNTYGSEFHMIFHGLTSYIFFKRLFSFNKTLTIILFTIYILLFGYEVKYYILFVEFLINIFKINKTNKIPISIFVLLLINKNLLYNYSILLTVLLNIYYIYGFKIGFKTYYGIISSLLFGSINFLYIFFYKYLFIFDLIIYLLSFLVIINPLFESIYIILINFVIYIDNINIVLRGSINILLIIAFYIFIHKYNLKNDYITLSIIVCLLISPFNNCVAHISYIDVGQGDATLIYDKFKNDVVLIDTGSKYNYYKLKKYLFKQGIYKIDYLIITHNDSDHNGNIDNLKNDFIITKIIDKGEDIALNNLYLKYYNLGVFDDDNDNSLVYSCNINDISFLFTGDISSKTEKIFVNEYGNTKFDILKISHHGSNTASSDYFISNIKPCIASISTSGQYNHPNKNVINTLEKYNVEYFITKNNGDIEIYFTKFINLLITSNWRFVIIG